MLEIIALSNKFPSFCRTFNWRLAFEDDESINTQMHRSMNAVYAYLREPC